MLYNAPMHDLSLGVAATIQHFKSRSAVARELGITRSAVSQWKSVPVEHVLTIEKSAGIPRHELRPDIYPPPQSEVAA